MHDLILCKSLRIIGLVWLTRLIFLAIGEVLSFGFNLAVSFPSDRRGSKARIVLLPSRIKRWENFVFATLAFANFSYATLEIDISLLPLFAFENTSQMPFPSKTDNFSFHFCRS